MREFQTAHKIQPINIRYLPNLQFKKKIAHNNNVQTYKKHRYTLFYEKLIYIRNLYWDGQIAKKLSVLELQRLRNL